MNKPGVEAPSSYTVFVKSFKIGAYIQDHVRNEIVLANNVNPKWDQEYYFE